MDIRETAINTESGKSTLTFFTSEIKNINKIKRLIKQHPTEITNIVYNDDGSICCDMPIGWFKLPKPPRKMSDEARAAASERFKQMHQNKKGCKD